MINAKVSRRIFDLIDVLGIAMIAVGLVVAGASISDGDGLTAIYGGAIASSGLGLVIVAHIGRALVQIAVTNTAILDRLTHTGTVPLASETTS